MQRWLFLACLVLVTIPITGCPTGNTGGKKIALVWDWPVYPENDYRIDSRVLELYDYNGKYHLGEDWNRIPQSGEDGDVDFGDSILAPAYGRVYSIRDTEDKDSWGKVIQLEHPMPDGSKAYSVFAHLEDILVVQNQEVYLGDQIGTIGNANGFYNQIDNGSSAHLHFEIRRIPWVLGDELGRGYIQRVTPEAVQDIRSPSLFIAMRQAVETIKLSKSGTTFSPTVMTGDTLVSFEYQGQFAGWSQAFENGWIDWPEVNDGGWHQGVFIFHPDYDYRIKAKKSGVKMHLNQPDWDNEVVERDAALADFIAFGLMPDAHISEIFPDTLDTNDRPSGTGPGKYQSIDVKTDYGRFKLYRGYDPSAPLSRILFFEESSGFGLTAQFWGTVNY